MSQNQAENKLSYLFIVIFGNIFVSLTKYFIFPNKTFGYLYKIFMDF